MEETSSTAYSRGYCEVSQYLCRAEEEEFTIDKVTIVVNNYVYKPAEDSYILAKTVERYLGEEYRPGNVFVEIGSGSGYVSIHLLTHLNSHMYGILTDVSPCAVYASWRSVKRSGLDAYVDVIQCDSAQCLRSSSTSIVFFNPPYLPVEEFNSIGIAWSGGINGVSVWRKFFSNAVRICLENLCTIIFILSSVQNLAKLLDVVLNSCRSIEIHECSEFFYETICSAVVGC